MYVRVDQQETKPVATGFKSFAGLSTTGDRLFYVAGFSLFDSPLFMFDVRDGSSTEIAPSGRFVNVAASGDRAYFLSSAAISGSGANPRGAEPVAGENNLYVWDEEAGTTGFVATVTPNDAKFEPPSLVWWALGAVAPEPNLFLGRGTDPSRTNSSGSALLFESQANITGYDSGGHTEIYR